MPDSENRRTRRPRRSAQALPPTNTDIRRFEHAYAPIDVFSVEEEEAVHRYSLQLLERTGLKFLSPDAVMAAVVSLRDAADLGAFFSAFSRD